MKGPSLEKGTRFFSHRGIMYIRFTTQLFFAIVLFGAFLVALHEAVAVTVVNTVEVKAVSGGKESTLLFSSSSVAAEAGRNGMDGTDGLDGADGQDGADGTNIGADGRSSVYVKSVINGVIVEEYGSATAAVRNEESTMHSILRGFAAVESPDDEYYAQIQELLAIVRLMLQAYVSEQL